MIKPISPNEIAETKKKVLPDFVIETFNELIAKNFSDGSATVYQDDIIVLLIERGQVDRDSIFENGWLNVEEIYRAEGWKVNYDKPDYTENFRTNFEFRKK